jgi:hypothetical protein
LAGTGASVIAGWAKAWGREAKVSFENRLPDSGHWSQMAMGYPGTDEILKIECL